MRDDEKKQISEIIEEWAKAVREENINGILANHSNNILMFDVPPPLQSKGIDAYKRSWNIFFSWSKKPVIFNINELEIITSNTVAYCHGIGQCMGIGSDDREESLKFRLTIGFIKEDGHWIITHEHHSLPSEA